MTIKGIILIATAVLFVGCGDTSTHTSSDTSNDASNDSATRAKPDLPGQGYDRALERARNVEQDVLDAAERQREQINEQDGGG